MEFSASVRGLLSETLWFCMRLCVEVGKTHRAWGQVWLLMSVDHHLLLWVQPLSSAEAAEFLHFIFWGSQQRGSQVGTGLCNL